MPLLTSSPAIAVESQEKLGYSWVKSPNGSRSLSRQLTNLECMFAIFNQKLYGQNVGFTGATISLQRRDRSPESESFNLSQLRTRAVEAFCQTRWKYPTVAAHLVDGDKALYNIESEEIVKSWAERTVCTVVQDGGWLALRDRLSRTSSLPTPEDDYHLFYLIVRPDEVAQSELKVFDILMHSHHAFHDGTGLRVILNEFLERIANPLAPEEMRWGQEVERLLPAATLLEKEEELEATNGAATNGKATNGTFTLPVPKQGLKGLYDADVGLPVYRPDIIAPKPEHRGSLLACHTFEDPSFLSQLLAVGRKHGIKLGPVLHATLLKAVYDSSDITPGPEDIYNSAAPMDLRNGYLIPEYCDRTKYVNNAVAIQPINVPCNMFSTEEGNTDGIWKAAACISSQWDAVRKKVGFGKGVERDAKARIESMANSKKLSTPGSIPKPRTCPSFVSDPPGSQGLRGTYPVSGYGDLNLVIESYQLAADQMQAAVSARSHSWNGLLTLCVVFNAVRNPRDKMEEFLKKWTEIVAEVCRDVL